jgi:hypothetical protein
MSIKFELSAFELGGIQPYGWGVFPGKWDGGVMGHEFTMVGVFKVLSKFHFSKGKTVDTLPALIWREKEFWWDGSTGVWEYKGESDKGDLYVSNPNSPTWSGFAQGKTEPNHHLWVSEPGGSVTENLRTRLFTATQRMQVQAAEAELRNVKSSVAYMKLATEKLTARGNRGFEILDQQWFMCAEKLASKKLRLPCAALDRPGMAQSGGSGKSGGGFVSKTTSPTRRRVLQFDLGMKGSSTRFTATQVLETKDGEPAISKFFYPGKSDDWCKNIPDDYLAYWRSCLNLANINDQTHTLESQDAVDEWQNWSRRMDAISGIR